MQLPQLMEVQGIRVLTTKQIAEAYEVDARTIQYNFRYNKSKYLLGKYYIEIVGEELRKLKTRNEFPSSLKYAKALYLWTEKGALLHAKSLNTDKAWEVYDYLVDYYFRTKGQQATQPAQEVKALPQPKRKVFVDIPENMEAQELIRKMRKFLAGADAILDKYNMYRSEENFRSTAATLNDISLDIYMLADRLKRFEPNLVEKPI